MSTPHPNTILFARGTLARLALWPALRLAVHASWGGPDSTSKQRWLASVLVDQFEPFIVSESNSRVGVSDVLDPTNVSTSTTGGPTESRNMSSTRTESPPDTIYIEEMLLQIMTDEFDVVLEDDSAAGVARDVLKLFVGVRTGDDTFVKELEAQAEGVKGKVPQHEMHVGSGSESGSGSEWEDEEESEEEPVPQLLNHRTKEEPQVDEDGFTMVTKGRR